MSRRPIASADDRAYRPFIAASLLLGIFGGFALALLLSIDAAEGFSLGARWPAVAQAHGHLQLIGFAGLFVIGMALRLAPRFVGRPLALPHLVPSVLGLLVASLLLRGLAQPLADNDAMAFLLAVSAILELAAAVTFAACILPTVGPAALERQPQALYFAAGTAWFILQAALGAYWLVELALDGELILQAAHDRLLVSLQLVGFVLSFVAGVVLRALPTFFRLRAPAWLVLLPFLLVQTGMLLLTIAGLVEVSSNDRPEAIENLGYVGTGIALAITALMTGFWRPAEGLRAPLRPLALPLRAAMAWLLLAAAYLVYVAGDAVSAGDPIAFARLDAARHILTLGVILTLIVGMANLVVPDLALQRTTRNQALWRGVVFTLALSLVVVLRTSDELLGGLISSDARYRHWAYAAAIAIAVLVVFAWLLARAARKSPTVITPVAAPAEQRDP